MRIFVIADMEGVSGICQSSQVKADGKNYEVGRRYLTWDVNHCVDGCFAGGATKVVVRDAHGGQNFNLVWERLDARAEYVQGSSRRGRMPRLETFDGLILLGYHAMAGTSGAILEHTMSSAHWQNLWINGRKCGEIAIDAGIAGDHGVPTIMASGDDKACREARSFIPGIVAVEVKKGLDLESGIMLPRQRAHGLIKAGAERAVRNCGKVKPFKIRHPVRMRLELVSRGRVPLRSPHVKAIDERTYEVVGGSVEEALNLLG